MSDSELLGLIRADVSRLNDTLERHMEAESKRWGEMQPLVAVLKNMAHASPCEPMQQRVMALEREQDQARGGLRVGLILVAIFSAITGGVAALIAIFK